MAKMPSWIRTGPIRTERTAEGMRAVMPVHFARLWWLRPSFWGWYLKHRAWRFLP